MITGAGPTHEHNEACRPRGNSSPRHGAVCVDLRSAFVPVPGGHRANSDFNPVYRSFYF